MRFFYGLLGDNIVLIPTLVLSLGRDPVTGQVAGTQVIASWLNFELGLEIDYWA